MNATAMERLALAINALRPEWPVASLQTLIESRLRAKAWQDVAVALAWVATDPATKTPARVVEPGPWWRTSFDSTARMKYPPRPEESCDRHAGQWADNCGGCAADDAERTTPAPERPPVTSRVSEHVAELRKLLPAPDDRPRADPYTEPRRVQGGAA